MIVLTSKTAKLNLMEQSIVCYLAAPLFLFYFGWLTPSIGIPCVILLAGQLYLLCGNREQSVSTSRLSLVIAVGAATAWTLLSGAGHFFYGNLDWQVRGAVLNDLVAYSWPTYYQLDGDAALLLRCPLAYYLIPAGLSKLTGISFAHPLLFAWTLLGVVMLFLSFRTSFASSRQMLYAVVIFILFSGLDIVGSLVNNHQLNITSHLEWWAAPFQYSSQTTMLFWAPNHALPGWLAATLIVRHWRDPLFPATLFAVLMLTLLWSPLTAIGIAMVLFGLVLYHGVTGNWHWMLSPVIIVALLTALPTMKYLAFHAAAMKSGWIWSFYPVKTLLYKALGQFWLFEVACFLPLFFYDRKERYLTGFGLLALLGIPVYYYGPSNDYVMRAAIPILAILALRTAATINDLLTARSTIPVVILVALLTVGAVTPGTEILRSLLTPNWAPERQATVVNLPSVLGAHYYTWVPRGALFPLKSP